MQKSLLAELKTAVKETESRPRRKRRGKGTRQVFKLHNVFQTRNMLSRLLRSIVIEEGITIPQIEDCLRQAIIRTGRKTNELHQDKENLISAISRDAVSFNKAFELLSTVLGYEVDVTIHLKKDKQEASYRYSEIYDKMRIRLGEENSGM